MIWLLPRAPIVIAHVTVVRCYLLGIWVYTGAGKGITLGR
jgi:hypothetical protein